MSNLLNKSPLSARFLFSICIAAIISSCSPSAHMLNRIPINKIHVKVVDQHDQPIKGAQVESSNGRESTTDKKGLAKIRFGSVGIHSVTVLADNYMPSNFLVTMPTDRDTTITRRLTGEVNIASVNFGSMNMYPLIFNYMFSSYGYSPQLEAYEPGQQTTWQINSDDNDEAMVMSKAYLKKLDNGKQWWRIMLDKAGNESSYTAEILFSKDRASILRYREKIGDNDVQEKPVSKGWYTKPVQLTKDSKKGAVKKENVSVDVPKGTFKADMLQFGVAPKTNLNIWRAKDSSVPGGVVKYETRDKDEVVYSNELKDFSNDAKTMLESY